MEEQHLLGPGQLTEPHGVVHGRVPEVDDGGKLGGGVLGVVQEEVDAVHQGQGGVVVRPPSVGPWPEVAALLPALFWLGGYSLNDCRNWPTTAARMPLGIPTRSENAIATTASNREFGSRAKYSSNTGV